MAPYKISQDSSTSSAYSSASDSTAATMYSEESSRDCYVPVSYPKTQLPPPHLYSYEPGYSSKPPRPRSSTSTYASTLDYADLPQTEEYHQPYHPPYTIIERTEFYPLDAVPSTPASFASHFPSSKRLLIRHDDTTVDGNMNLRIDTPVHMRDGSQRDITLFHLRMHDLFSRKFSLRRYCRDSGREVCHSARREVAPAQDKGPYFRRSWSNVFGLMPGSSSPGNTSPHGEFQRRNSGFSSNDDHLDSGERPTLSETILLEFSNYAHVEVRRKGGSNKKYEFEYWATKYQWRREIRNEGDLQAVSYFLVDAQSGKTVAHMMPDILAPPEAIEEEKKGGWVPPSSLWISDPEVYRTMPDVAE